MQQVEPITEEEERMLQQLEEEEWNQEDDYLADFESHVHLLTRKNSLKIFFYYIAVTLSNECIYTIE